MTFRKEHLAVVAALAAIFILPQTAQAQRFPRAARLLDRMRPPVRTVIVAPPWADPRQGGTVDLQLYAPAFPGFGPGWIIEWGANRGAYDQAAAPPSVPQADLKTQEEIPTPDQQSSAIPSEARAPASAEEQLTRAKQSMRSADYEQALRLLNQLLSAEPRNGEAMLLAAHALFGLREFPQAAETLRAAISLLPADRWDEGVSNYREYFVTPVEFAERLRGLEEYALERDSQPAGHMLLGYYYGYLGLRGDAVSELRKALAIDANDGAAAALITQFQEQSRSPSPPAPPTAMPQTTTSEVERDVHPAAPSEGPLLFAPRGET